MLHLPEGAATSLSAMRSGAEGSPRWKTASGPLRTMPRCLAGWGRVRRAVSRVSKSKDDGAQTIRYYGRYSNVSRAKTARCAQLPDHTPQAQVPKEDSESEWLKERKSTWAALIKLIYESDTLLCPSCHIQMKIISVIKDGAVIDKIVDHLKFKFEVLPLSARPPPEGSPYHSDFPLDSPVWTEGD